MCKSMVDTKQYKYLITDLQVKANHIQTQTDANTDVLETEWDRNVQSDNWPRSADELDTRLRYTFGQKLCRVITGAHYVHEEN